MGKVVAIKQQLISFSGIALVRPADPDVAGKAFQVLQSFDVVRIEFHGSKSRCECFLRLSQISIDAAEIHLDSRRTLIKFK